MILKDLKDDEIPVLLEIDMTLGSLAGNNIYLNNQELTVYPQDSEVLLNNGIDLYVNSVIQELDIPTGTLFN